VSKRKKPARPVEPVETVETEANEEARAPSSPEMLGDDSRESVTTRTALPSEVLAQAMAAKDSERAILAALRSEASASEPQLQLDDVETTVNVTGDMLPFPGRDDLDAPTVTVAAETLEEVDSLVVQRRHLRGLLEALIFASDAPIKPKELAKLASAPVKQVNELLPEIRHEFSTRGIHLEELAGGWVFRTSAQYAPFIRDLTKQRPVRLTRAQVETLAIIAYRQPITRPEIDDVRGVDSGPVLKLLLERDLVRILGKRDEPGRPLIYGTTTHFLEFFGLKSLKDLPTLREFTELTDESRDTYEAEMGEPPNDAPPPPPEGDVAPSSEREAAGHDLEGLASDVVDPPDAFDGDEMSETGRPPYETAPDVEEPDMGEDADLRDSMAVPAGTHEARSRSDDVPPSSGGTENMMNALDDGPTIATTSSSKGIGSLDEDESDSDDGEE
jgi:segregation and condensation protein B